MNGKLYGVGIGPGDEELITLKAVRIIKQSGIIAVPKSGEGERVALGIAKQAVPEIADKQILELDMPMTHDVNVLNLSHNEAAERIIKYLKNGIDIAFLTLGDPCIYSTYIYIHRIVKEKGYNAEIIPGGTFFCAVSAKLDDALVETSQHLHVLPGVYGNLKENLELSGTKVLMKSGKAFIDIRDQIIEMGLSDNAKMIENCGLENERIYDNLKDADKTSGYFSIIIVKDKKI